MAGEAITPELCLTPPTTSCSLLKDSIGIVQPSSKHDDKKRGKWTRSVERIGSLSLEEAERIAAQLTHRSEDLTLYRWCDIREDWKKFEWMSPNDVVLRGTICLLCYQNIPLPAFHSHMRAEHPSEDNDVIEITKRLSEVRLSRFQTLGVVDKDVISQEFPDIPFPILESFLIDCGFIVQELRNVDPIKTISKSRRRTLSRPQDTQLDEDIYAEDDIKGISSQDAQDIAEILCSNGGCSKDVFFSSSFTASTAAGIRRNYHRVYCPICQVVISDVKLRQHMKGLFHVTLSPIDENSYEIIRRLTDVRLWKFFSVNPIPKWKVDELCSGNSVLSDKLSNFLVHRGFVINPEQLSSGGFISRVENSDMDDDSIDSASTCSSYSSSSSSAASGSSTDSFISYPVMHSIRNDPRIMEALSELEQKLCINDGALDQFEFLFVLGYAMYSLVVANGCKLAVLSNLREGDVTRTMDVKDSGLRMVHFSSKSTCTGGRQSNFLVLDVQVQQALRMFILAKQWRADVLRCSAVTHAENLFFVSYSLKGLRNNDVDYPISQFLRMCGIRWKFLASHLINASQDMVAKDFKNSTGEQALTYYKKLQEKCDAASCSESPSTNPLVQNICVSMTSKARKDKGSIKGPMRGYSSNSSLFADRSRVKFNPYTNRNAKYIKRISRELGSEAISTDMETEASDYKSEHSHSAESMVEANVELPFYPSLPESCDPQDFSRIDNL